MLQPEFLLPSQHYAAPHRVHAVRCTDKLTWDWIAGASPISDVYYRPGYAMAHEKAGHGRASAVLINAGSTQFLVPILLRPLSELPFAHGVEGYDAISPYGYGGLLKLSGPDSVSALAIRDFFENLRDWCREAGVIAVLLRLHPLLNQESWFSQNTDDAQLCAFGPTIALDLKEWDQEANQLKTMSKGRKSDLACARKNLRLTWASDSYSERHRNLSIFQALYEERMRALQAAPFYLFANEYYTQLAAGLGKDLDIAIAWLNDEPVGGGMFLAGKRYAHYHLSATNELGRKHKASTLLINAACSWAQSRGCHQFHLGGGTKGVDSLFRFKESFGGEQKQYSYVTFIANPEHYRDLCADRNRADTLPAPRANFFPAYRA